MDITGHSLSTTLVSTEEARLLRTLMEHSRVAMAVATRAGEISYLNPAVTLRYGRKLSRATSVEEFIRFATPDAKAQENALLYWKSNISDLREDFPHANDRFSFYF